MHRLGQRGIKWINKSARTVGRDGVIGVQIGQDKCSNSISAVSLSRLGVDSQRRVLAFSSCAASFEVLNSFSRDFVRCVTSQDCFMAGFADTLQCSGLFEDLCVELWFEGTQENNFDKGQLRSNHQ